MAHLITPEPAHYTVLAEGLTSDGRVVRRVEARADGLADVAEAFRLAAAEARTAHVPVASVRLTAGRGRTEIAVTLDEGDPLGQSALLDGKTKVDVPASVCIPKGGLTGVLAPSKSTAQSPTAACTCRPGSRLACSAHRNTPAGELYAEIVRVGGSWNLTGRTTRSWEVRETPTGDLEVLFEGRPIALVCPTADLAKAALAAYNLAYGSRP